MTQKRDHIVRNTFRDLMIEALKHEDFRRKFQAIFDTTNPCTIFAKGKFYRHNQRVMADYFARVARELRLSAGDAK